MEKLNFIKIENAFNKISLRERIYIFCALLICVFSISYFWILDPAMIKQEKAEKIWIKSYEQEKKINNQIAELKLRLKKNPLQEVNKKIALSEQTLVELDKQLELKLVKFIHAQKMSLALSRVLSKSPGVKVESLTTLPVTVFNALENAQQSTKSVFYKHTLEIKLVGNYNAIYRYFLNLEALQDKFYWSTLTYQVADYPLANVTIQIYTLSDQQDLVSG